MTQLPYPMTLQQKQITVVIASHYTVSRVVCVCVCVRAFGTNARVTCTQRRTDRQTDGVVLVVHEDGQILVGDARKKSS